LVHRARIVLLAADGMANAAVGRQVGVSTPTVLAWRNRYDTGGIEALVDLPRSGRPPVSDEAAVITHTLNPPPDELAVTHWSARLLADHLRRSGLAVSFAEVARIWRESGLQPHRVETFKFSTDPQLEAKVGTCQDFSDSPQCGQPLNEGLRLVLVPGRFRLRGEGQNYE
jgi:transposase